MAFSDKYDRLPYDVDDPDPHPLRAAGAVFEGFAAVVLFLIGAGGIVTVHGPRTEFDVVLTAITLRIGCGCAVSCVRHARGAAKITGMIALCGYLLVLAFIAWAVLPDMQYLETVWRYWLGG